MTSSAKNSAWYQSSCHIKTSLWGKTAGDLPELSPLSQDISVDVAVVGAGFCGLSTALHLAEQGVNVAVVDAHEPGWGASGRNGGQVIPGLKILPDEMVERFGSERGEQIATTAGSAPGLVFDLIDRYKIDCDLRRTGWFQLAKGDHGRVTTDSHVDQWGQRGVSVRTLRKDEIEPRIGTTAYASGLIDDRGGNLHPLKYARGLAAACLSLGVQIYPKTPATAVQHNSKHWQVTTENGTISAETVVVCTNGYTGTMLPGLANSIVPVLTGVVATDPLSDNLKSKILPERQGAADTQRLLSWFGIDAEDRLLFGSRINTQKEVIHEDNFGFGLSRMREIFPEVDIKTVQHLWTGRVALTLDHVPHIHKLAEGLYSGLGFNGRGVAMGTMFGKILAAHCTDKQGDDFLPLTPMPKIPFNRFRNQGITIALTWKRMMDTLRP
ncbi:MAG: FAD-binding oxidoreductase [Paracoccaceae bacterium]|nr:FAD-binding oxidoreductase [Paracoccaceae bacterium]MDG1737667.1 FAD-binding oxidoreductase [Paracoccaceae bacterium]MDG2257654.1 FAD-binding oxidoreductase [Paracoccaceae bacterium]